MNTLFEKNIAGEIPAFKIWEDEDFFAFLDIAPINPGHTLLVQNLQACTFLTLQKAQELIQRELSC